MKSILISLCLCIAQLAIGQHDFVSQCEGVWTGTMNIYAQGEKVPNGPNVTFTVKTVIKDSSWTWRTDYDSKKYGRMSKDYTLKVKDASKGHYLLDEGDGISLDYQVSGSKMYAVFEVEGTVLSSTYELRKDQLIFEVYSSPKSRDTTQVLSHRVQNVQRVTLLPAGKSGLQKQ